VAGDVCGAGGATVTGWPASDRDDVDTMTDHPTCDMSDCERDGYARYRHVDGHWIDVCGPHKPSCTGAGTMPNGTAIYYHTINHRAYPAKTVSEYHNPSSFKYTHE
jgi:hypothetical protein